MWLRKSVILSLVFALIGFIIGSLWSNFSAILRPISLSIAENIVQLDVQLNAYSQSRPIESALVFTVLGAVLGVSITPALMGLLKIKNTLFRKRTMVDLMFKSEAHVHAVVYHMTQESFIRIGGQRILLPVNAVFLPYGDATSRVPLSNYCHRHYGDKKAVMFHDHDDRWELKDHNFLCVGGPFTNKIVKHVLESTQIPGFTIDYTPSALDEGDQYQAERENASSSPDAPLAKDYGFIIFMQSPWNCERKICLLFGLWTQGTQAAVETILQEPMRLTYLKRLVKRLIKRATHFEDLYLSVKRGQNMLGIVQVRVTGLLAGKPELVKVRTF